MAVWTTTGIWRGMDQQARENPDRQLLQQIAEGSREAFEQLYRAWQTRLFRYLLRMVGDSGTAEELTNDTMIAAWKAAASFKGQSKVSTWLFAIARNKALNSLRQHQPETVEVEEAMAATASAGGQEVSVSRDRLQSVMKAALQQLSPDHREVMELTFYQELSYQEIAEIMQCPVNTVKTRMFYAKKKLQEILASRGITGELL